MRYSFHYHFEKPANSLIMPLSSGKDLDAGLQIASELTGIAMPWLKAHFKGEKNDLLIIPFSKDKKAKTLFLKSVGTALDENSCAKALRSLVFQKKAQLEQTIGLVLAHAPDQVNSVLEGCVHGLEMSRYQIGSFQSEKPVQHPFDHKEAMVKVYVKKGVEKDLELATRKGIATARTRIRIMDLVNAPANKKAPSALAEWAVQSGKEFGYSVKVLEKKEIEKLGLHALLAVNRGSEYPPVFIVMEYQPTEKSAKKKLPQIGLVGKGVTFDTGGISLKPPPNMHYMKSDMGGAAAILGAVEVAARLQLPVHLVAVIPSTDNSIDAKSIKPSDVIDSYSGKTIEIIDTDAEGRLILADGLAYITKNFKPEVLIDAATLTGSAVRTFGYHCGALFCNDAEISKFLTDAGELTGERVWPLPLWDLYAEEVKSDVADVRNLSGKPMAGAITAAKFLEVFTNGHPKWAHLDIAGVSFQDSEFSVQKSATGFGVRLFKTFFEQFIESRKGSKK